ncbi:TonB-dependent receptor domain-containing protein [Melioribacteraceae bacterium 4301-Me]|uniref:TonB-dependent receptor n=1 Tax=Pyranulibacter aquaticus TaxID=3163344 RepID=UPI00359B4BDD
MNKTVKKQTFHKIRFLLLAVIMLFTYDYLSAQTTGKLAGRVVDENGQPLIGTNVIVLETTAGASTDLDGYYSIINLRAGTYKIKFQYIGYQSKVYENVRITSDQTTQLNVTLTPEAVQGQEVVVVAQRPIVNFNETSSVVSVNKEEIKNLPLQSLNEIVNLQAGVIDGHFRGGRIGEVQYQVDGVSVVNPYDNSSTLTLDKSILEEVQVISGTFDAKYGQAMSGVVNAVLRSGGDRFQFSGEIYGGDYFTTDTKRYPHNNTYNPTGIRNLQLTLSGPTGISNTSFLISGRRFLDDGYLFGVRKFLPTDKNNFEQKIFNPTGDNKLVPMQYYKEWSGQFKLTNKSIPNVELSYQATGNLTKRSYYNHYFRLDPDGIKENTTKSLSHGLSFTHTLSTSMFYKINLRQNYFNYSDYKYENLYDPRYLEAGQPKGDPNYEDGAFLQGVDLSRFKQKTISYILKGDFTWQANRIHLLEAGFEGQYSEITFGSPGFIVTTNVNGVEILQPRENIPRVPGIQTYFPKQMAAYLQDRIELGDLIVRAGLRFEYFDPHAKIPSDLSNPANSIQGAPKSFLKRTTIKTALAPRLGLSFPLTSSSSVYFSYGHFYQLPGLGLLYNNADYSILDELQAGGISYGVMGNPDLNPEFTIQYEAGYKQAIGNNFGAEISFFYKDIRDLLGVEFVSTYTAAEYARFTNVDFGNVYGFTISLTQRNFGNISTTLDYTLQYAQGNSSDPRETANRAAAGKDARPRTIFFDWDQRHTLNATVLYNLPDDFSISAIFKLGTGTPYTPEIGTGFGADLETNTGRKPTYFVVDLRGEKYFHIGALRISVFARAFNLFNQDFLNGFVFASTGSPDYTLTPEAQRAQLTDPSRFYMPRRIEFGITFGSK